MTKRNLALTIVIWFIIGLLAGGVITTFVQKRTSPNSAPTTTTEPNLAHVMDSLQTAKNSTALLVARDSITVLETKYRQLLGKFVIGDTVKTKTNTATPIDKTVIVHVADTIYLDGSGIFDWIKKDTTPQYGLRLPYKFKIENPFVGLAINIDKDSATLQQLNIYGSVEVEKSEKILPGNKVQRSVMFRRSNPYITAFSDGYVEEPRLTNKVWYSNK